MGKQLWAPLKNSMGRFKTRLSSHLAVMQQNVHNLQLAFD
jgi:hypothetical protein